MQESLSAYWKRRCGITSNTDNVLALCKERIQGDIINAINARQCSAVVLILDVDIPRQVYFEVYGKADVHPDIWFPLGEMEGPRKVTMYGDMSGYRLHERFLGVVKWLKCMGLSVHLSSSLELIARWCPASAVSEHDPNTLYKYYMQLMQYPGEDDIDTWSRIRSGIKRAMECGQRQSDVCCLYRGENGFKEYTPEDIVGAQYVCREHSLIVTGKAQTSLVDRIIEKEKLQWSLRPSEDWCILYVYWLK